MSKRDIYHGSSPSKGGFMGPNPDTLRMTLGVNDFHEALVSGGSKVTKTVPLNTTYGIRAMALDQTERAFAQFPLVNKQWTREIAVTTGIDVAVHWWSENAAVAPNDVVKLDTNIFVFLNGETINTVVDSGTIITDTQLNAYDLNVSTYTDHVVRHWAGGLMPRDESFFYVSLMRLGAGDGDTFTRTVNVVGMSIEFPLR